MANHCQVNALPTGDVQIVVDRRTAEILSRAIYRAARIPGDVEDSRWLETVSFNIDTMLERLPPVGGAS